jgi:putative Holliday junction resolvase
VTIRAGVRRVIDVGTARIGVARSDADGLLALPVSTVSRGDGDLAEVQARIAEFGAVELVVGLPLSLSGARTASTEDAVAFAERLAAASGLPVRLVDERLSTVSAQHALHAAGRDARRSRPVIDQVAAAIILQHALDVERSSGNPPGELIALDEG